MKGSREHNSSCQKGGFKAGKLCVFLKQPTPPMASSFHTLPPACLRSCFCLFFFFLWTLSAIFFSVCFSVYSLLPPPPPLSLPFFFSDLEVWKCSFTLPLLHKLLFYFLQLQMLLPAHFKWNKRVSRFCSNNLFHVLFGRLFCWPSSSQSVWKKNGNSSFWVLISCGLLELFFVSAHGGYWITAFSYQLLSLTPLHCLSFYLSHISPLFLSVSLQ